MKKIAILGITGSIGDSTCQVINAHPDKFKIVLASAHSNQKKLIRLAHKFNIKNLVLTGSSKLKYDSIDGADLHFGMNSLLNLISDLDIDIVLNAISGSAGLLASVTTIQKGTKLALANKESLVLAGHIIKKIAALSQAEILPVDSEHSAVFQCLASHSKSEIKKITLTASGGPFRDLPLADFPAITLKDTLRHPTWSMGHKVTIDSATMLNKALEVIEAHWLFELEYENIDAVIHKHSIVHSFLQFKDGSILAQLSNPTMKLPILYALSHPQHIEAELVQTDILNLPPLTFSKIDPNKFPLYYLGRKCAIIGGLLPTIYNAANEAAIKLFLDRKIHFTKIAEIVSDACQNEENISEPDLDTILAANKRVFNKYLKLP